MSSTPLLDPPRSGTIGTGHPIRPGSWLALGGVGGFFAAGLLTGLVTPGYDERREAMSALAALDSPHAWLMMAGFGLGAVGLLAGAFVLWQVVPQRAGRVAAVLVAASGALIALAGAARQDCSDQLPSCRDFGDAVEASGSYWVHQYASLLAFLLLIVSFFVVARGLRRSGRARLASLSRLAGAASFTGIVLLVVEPPFVGDNYGLVQRLVLLGMFAWPVAVGVLASRRS